MASILLIEPDSLLAKSYQSYLQSQNYLVTIEASAQAAITAADKLKPDLIIVELQLIDHSGIEFLYELRSYSDWQTIPVIVQSQVPPAEFNHNWQLLRDELGVKEYLYKPVTSLKDLHRCVNAHLVEA